VAGHVLLQARLRWSDYIFVKKNVRQRNGEPSMTRELLVGRRRRGCPGIAYRSMAMQDVENPSL